MLLDDEHRVVLSTLEGEEDSDYINASKLMVSFLLFFTFRFARN